MENFTFYDDRSIAVWCIVLYKLARGFSGGICFMVLIEWMD